MLNVATEKTRAGLLPIDNVLKYKINTKQVENYLQQKINFITKNTGEDIPISAETFHAGTAFYPIIVALPSDVLKDKGGHDDVRSIFDEKGQESTDYIRDDFKKLLSTMQYTDRDIKMLFEYKNKKQLGINANNALTLKKFQHTKKLRFGKSDADSVVFTAIDPLAVFHDMLTVQSDSRPFLINIEKVVRIEDSNYEYFISREIKNGKNALRNKQQNFFTEMGRKMRK